MSGMADAVRVVSAQREGKAAGSAGEPVTACPYEPDAEAPLEQALARMWLRGYDQARPMPVDYS